MCLRIVSLQDQILYWPVNLLFPFNLWRYTIPDYSRKLMFWVLWNLFRKELHQQHIFLGREMVNPGLHWWTVGPPRFTEGTKLPSNVRTNCHPACEKHCYPVWEKNATMCDRNAILCHMVCDENAILCEIKMPCCAWQKCNPVWNKNAMLCVTKNALLCEKKHGHAVSDETAILCDIKMPSFVW